MQKLLEFSTPWLRNARRPLKEEWTGPGLQVRCAKLIEASQPQFHGALIPQHSLPWKPGHGTGGHWWCGEVRESCQGLAFDPGYWATKSRGILGLSGRARIYEFPNFLARQRDGIAARAGLMIFFMKHFLLGLYCNRKHTRLIIQ